MVTHRESWARGRPADTELGLTGDKYMVNFWSDFGFIVPRKTPDTPDEKLVYVETERLPYAGINYREYFYIMMNIESHPEFLPKARKLVDFFLEDAWKKQQSDEEFPTQYLFFKYSKEAFLDRMD